MRTFRLLFLFLAGGFFGTQAQEVLSAYKYVIVPTKFESFKKENEYQTSTLLKHLLVEKGFNAVYDNALPSELSNNRCLGLTAILVDESGMLTTKGHISFQDCQSQEVFRTQTANSKIKDYKGAFKETITEAMESLNNYTYSYQPAEVKEAPITVNFGDDVKTLEPDPVPTEKIEEITTKAKEVSGIPVVQEKETGVSKPTVPEIKEVPQVAKETVPSVPEAKDSFLLYAQQIPNGFQLVDSSPKVLLRIYETGKKGVFLARGDASEGIVYEDQGNWYFDYYKDGELVHQTLNIKF
ncbi:hypothetical protein [Lentiprolixibacter aurantiacus]|uniref:Uncharacterized protein n=1 Tax=Lentiprolixibacter aurantiacus TaxID=2993939 RepID=A0AAE3MNZ4_9FLAO|nr:hypothetical protein [Lentiprolixibacter aurantiacus]MCX2720698.1 hypothetical protein [Lentiprolixibacter aurantiacus]